MFIIPDGFRKYTVAWPSDAYFSGHDLLELVGAAARERFGPGRVHLEQLFSGRFDNELNKLSTDYVASRVVVNSFSFGHSAMLVSQTLVESACYHHLDMYADGVVYVSPLMSRLSDVCTQIVERRKLANVGKKGLNVGITIRRQTSR